MWRATKERLQSVVTTSKEASNLLLDEFGIALPTLQQKAQAAKAKSKGTRKGKGKGKAKGKAAGSRKRGRAE